MLVVIKRNLRGGKRALTNGSFFAGCHDYLESSEIERRSCQETELKRKRRRYLDIEDVLSCLAGGFYLIFLILSFPALGYLHNQRASTKPIYGRISQSLTSTANARQANFLD